MNHPANNQSGSRQQPGMPTQNRHSGSFGPNGEIPVPMYGNGRDRGGSQSVDLARSPPNVSNKNTKHVPCKFFRQGACQAGNACPFSHSLDPLMQQAPCKYFMKGNCKFGAKCALAHYLPNGHRVSRADLDVGMGMGSRTGYAGGGRADASPLPPPQDSPAFPDPYMQQPYTNQDFYLGQEQFLLLDDESDAYQDRYNQYRNSDNFEISLNSPSASQFGSPPNDGIYPKGAAENMRSALNAPLPASFDANVLPHIAKYGPFGQSVPDKFGMRSPPNSAFTRKLGSPPDALPTNKTSTIGSALRNVSSPLSMSPQTGEESIGQRMMHSQKSTKPRMISASVPRSSLYPWDDNLGTETDLLPNSLHEEILLPQEKIRRMSRPDQELSSSARERSNGLNIPRRSSNVGSPPTGSSPSRFRGLFEEQRRKEEATTPNLGFGNVGSPLRESWMPNETKTDSARAIQISGISQAMARMGLERTDSTETNGSTRPLGLRSNSNVSRFDRTTSSPGLTGRKIDEEGEGGFFEMDDESSKRNSSIWLSSQSSTSARERSSEETPRTAGGTLPPPPVGFNIGSGARPIFGFKP